MLYFLLSALNFFTAFFSFDMLKREKIISKIEEETHNVDGNIRKNGPEYE